MATDEADDDRIVPARYPELALLVWNRDPERPIAARDAFSLYERNWRLVDVERMTPEERRLLARLTALYGNGVLLV